MAVGQLNTKERRKTSMNHPTSIFQRLGVYPRSRYKGPRLYKCTRGPTLYVRLLVPLLITLNADPSMQEPRVGYKSPRLGYEECCRTINTSVVSNRGGGPDIILLYLVYSLEPYAYRS